MECQFRLPSGAAVLFGDLASEPDSEGSDPNSAPP